MSMSENHDNLFQYTLRQGDTSLVLGHRLSEWCGHAPAMEEDVALANLALDFIGQARILLRYAGEVEDAGRSEDSLAYLRDGRDYRNLLLAEQPNGDFGMTITRQFLFDAWQLEYLKRLADSEDQLLAGYAAKATKEAVYHLRHSSEWMIRLGDGTEFSHGKVQTALNELWMYTGELFAMDEVDRAMVAAGIGVDTSSLRGDWDRTVNRVLQGATLARPEEGWMAAGGKTGTHTEYLGLMLAEMQSLHRAYPGCEW